MDFDVYAADAGSAMRFKNKDGESLALPAVLVTLGAAEIIVAAWHSSTGWTALKTLLVGVPLFVLTVWVCWWRPTTPKEGRISNVVCLALLVTPTAVAVISLTTPEEKWRLVEPPLITGDIREVPLRWTGIDLGAPLSEWKRVDSDRTAYKTESACLDDRAAEERARASFLGWAKTQTDHLLVESVSYYEFQLQAIRAARCVTIEEIRASFEQEQQKEREAQRSLSTVPRDARALDAVRRAKGCLAAWQRRSSLN